MGFGAIAAGIGGILGPIGGALINKRATDKANRQNVGMNYDFARNSIKWKVQDAKEAGIGPLAALGVPGIQPAVGVMADNSVGNALSAMGQNAGRAMRATQTKEEKEIGIALQREALKQARLRTKGLADAVGPRKEINSTDFPDPSTNFIPGQSSGPLVDNTPVKKNKSQPGKPAQEAGWRPDRSFSRTDTGLAPMIPEGLSESLEDDFIGKMQWRYRNQIRAALFGEGKPAKNQLPKGYKDWRFDLKTFTWKPSKKKELSNWEKYKRWKPFN